MPRFRYKAVAPGGNVIQGEMQAMSRTAVVEHLRGEGHLPIRADELKGQAGAWSLPGLLSRTKTLSGADLALLTRELSTLLGAGIALDRALAILGDLLGKGQQKEFVRGVLDRVRGGATLADAFAAQDPRIPGFYLGMVRAGEAGGALESVLARLAESLERSQALKDNVKSAMVYPVLVLILAGASLIILLTVVVPEFRPLFAEMGGRMPRSTEIIIAVGEGLRRFWWLLALLVVLLVLAVRRHNSGAEGRLRWDRWILRVPLLGDLVTKLEVARFSRVLGTLLGSGVAVLAALSIATGTLGNRWISRAVETSALKLKRGEGLARPLAQSGVFPPLAVQLVQVGEEGGQLEAMLLRVAEIYDGEVQRTLQRLLSLLVPAITVVLGLIVAGITGSLITAILSAYDLPF